MRRLCLKTLLLLAVVARCCFGESVGLQQRLRATKNTQYDEQKQSLQHGEGSAVQQQRRELYWWSILFFHVRHRHGDGSGGNDGNSSGGESSGGSGGGSSSTTGDGSSGGGNSGNGDNANGGGGNGSNANGGGGEGGEEGTSSSATLEESVEGGGDNARSRWQWFWDLVRFKRTSSEEDYVDSNSSGTGDDTLAGDDSSAKDANQGTGFDFNGITSIKPTDIVMMVIIACVVAVLVVGAVFLLCRIVKLSQARKKLDASILKADAWAARLNRKKKSMRYRVFGIKHKEPLIVMRRPDSDDSGSITSAESVPPRPAQTRPPATPRTQHIPEVRVSDGDDDNDDTDADDDNEEEEEEEAEEEDSVVSVYTAGQEESMCLRTVSMDEESVPMDEAADRRSRIAIAPLPLPMDEEAIDATIKRSLMAANEIIKKHRSRQHVVGLTRLDDI